MENGPVDNSYVVTTTPHLTKEEVVVLVREDLRARTFHYDTEKGFYPVFCGFQEIRDGRIRPIWSVAFATPARQVHLRGEIVEVFEKDYYACIDDESKELLYIIHSTGYMEPVGAK